MKKILLLILVLFITACSNQNNIENVKNDIDVKEDVVEEKKYVDENPIKVGLYMNNNSNKKEFISEYSPTWALHKDLCSLEIYYTDEKEINSSDQKSLWEKYYGGYSDIKKYKLGFNIEFDTDEGHKNDLILSPKDTEKSFCLFVLMYLYDDINNSGFYSHLTEDDMNDNTIVSSIKLTAGTYYEKITSDIKLTVFTYDDDDFDENNNYIGNSKHTIIIKK